MVREGASLYLIFPWFKKVANFPALSIKNGGRGFLA